MTQPVGVDQPEFTCDLVLASVDFPPLNGRRDGEVLMVVRRHSGRAMMMRKRSYPREGYRLPTGGIKSGERLHAALLREVAEETNLEVQIERFLGTLHYHADLPGAPSPGTRVYSTHAFLVNEVAGDFGTNDESEGIDSWIEADEDDLLAQAATLESLGANPRNSFDWGNWGRFRAIGHHLVDLSLRDPQGASGGADRSAKLIARLAPIGFARLA